MILNHAGINSIYQCVGDERFESLLLNSKKKTNKYVANNDVILLIFDAIKNRGKIKKSALMKECKVSMSTLNNAINEMIKCGTILKKQDRNSSGKPVTYSLKKRM